MTAPFVLLDDARPQGAVPARLYRSPAEIVTAVHPDEVRPALERLRHAQAEGLHAAGFLSYEAGHALERKLAPIARPAAEGAPPLLWFGLFDRFETVDAGGMLADPAGAWASPPRPLIARSDYEAAVDRAKGHIEAGDIYQANISFPAEVAFAGSPLALYAKVRERAWAGHGGIVFTGEHWLLSFSPELFFSLAGRRVTTRPMKGTAARGATPEEDRHLIDALGEDPKQRAENLMIVDLLRNDLSRVSKPGSVKVPSLFAIETYPTVHQMTSTVVSELEEGVGAIDLIGAVFPCGSITGAPKIRAMELIDAIEGRPRGPYTGAIGRIDPRGDAEFNVAIRTLTIEAGQNRAVLGLGSGIVADSRAGDEWRECLAKGAFVSDGGNRFDLIETMRFDPEAGLVELEAHLARMKASAEALGFAFDRHGARNELQAATFRLSRPQMVRLLLSPGGAVAIECRPLPPMPAEPVEVAVAPLPVERDDFRLRHKTSDRAFYDEARLAGDGFETIFVDPDGFVTEGSFTNVFVEKDGTILTPPAARGLLAGILRGRLIEEGRVAEADLTIDDLRAEFYIGNSVRGFMLARLSDGSASPCYVVGEREVSA